MFSQDQAYRYTLERTWDADLPVACFVMLNPSTATESVLDPTVRRCLGFAREWGCGSLLVLNAFALRSTDPKVLYGHFDPVGCDNDEVIRRTLAERRPWVVIAAWGSHAAKIDGRGRRKPRGNTWAALHWSSRAAVLVQHVLPSSLTALAVTKDGQPGHPLYLPATALPAPFPGAPAPGAGC